MLKEKYTIRMHSFVDLITNSSTELYIEATKQTIKSLKALINNLLKLGGSTLTCDDLFTIKINKERFRSEYSWDDDKDVKKLDANEFYAKWIGDEFHEGYRDVHLLVKCRDTNNPLGMATAEVLANLTDMFNIDAQENR